MKRRFVPSNSFLNEFMDFYKGYVHGLVLQYQDGITIDFGKVFNKN